MPGFREEMSKRDLTVAALAESSGISKATIYRLLESVTSNPREKVVKALAAAMELAPEDLETILKSGGRTSAEAVLGKTFAVSTSTTAGDWGLGDLVDISGLLARDMPELSDNNRALLSAILVFYRRKAMKAEKLPKGYEFFDHGTDELIKAILEAVAAENSEIMITGTSLLAFLAKGRYSEVCSLLKKKMVEGVRVRFLITHPFATMVPTPGYLNQDRVGLEVIKALRLLKDEWKLPVEDVRLYMGPPICFGIRTQAVILMTIYPYGVRTAECPHLMVRRNEAMTLYQQCDSSHFMEWSGPKSAEIGNYDQTIDSIEKGLSDRAKEINDFWQRHVEEMLGVCR